MLVSLQSLQFFLQIEPFTAKKMDGKNKDGILRTAQSVDDMTIFVQCLLQEMHSRLRTLTEYMKAKLDEMGTRLDVLDRGIKDSRIEVAGFDTISSLSTLETDEADSLMPTV